MEFSEYFPTKLLQRLSEAQNHHCCYCGRVMTYDYGKDTSATKDHLLPRSQNGRNAWYNLVAACQQCNESRGTMDAYEFFELRKKGLAHLHKVGSRDRLDSYRARLKVLRLQAAYDRSAAWDYFELKSQIKGYASD